MLVPTHHGPKFSGAARNAPISQKGGTHGAGAWQGKGVGRARRWQESRCQPVAGTSTGQNGDADPAAEKSALPVHEEIRDQQPEKSS